MSKKFKSIKKSLHEAIAHAEGGAPGTRIHRLRPVDVKALRSNMNDTGAICCTLRILYSDITSLGAWRQSASWFRASIVNLIEHNPKAVIDALMP